MKKSHEMAWGALTGLLIAVGGVAVYEIVIKKPSSPHFTINGQSATVTLTNGGNFTLAGSGFTPNGTIGILEQTVPIQFNMPPPAGIGTTSADTSGDIPSFTVTFNGLGLPSGGIVYAALYDYGKAVYSNQITITVA